ncbi:hypothetical protein OCF61_03195 [Bacillus cereus]|nr:hypothetical protein [Bacillus cereus]
MSNIYQEIWDADMSENGIKATFDKTNIDYKEEGYILVDPKNVPKSEQLNHQLFKEVFIPARKITSYTLFEKLFNNFYLDPHLREDNTVEEQGEVDALLKHAIQSKAMKLCRTYVESKKETTLSDEQWYTYLHNIWFLQYNRGSSFNLSGFERVFIGEMNTRGNSLVGYHFWYKYYFDDITGPNDKIIYLGPKDTNNVPDVITLAYTIEASDNKNDGITLLKNKSGFFVGLSPEGLLAIGTARFADTMSEHKIIEINNQKYDLVMYTNGKRSMMTFYPVLR